MGKNTSKTAKPKAAQGPRITIRLTPFIAGKIKVLADADHRSPSGYIRKLILENIAAA